MSHKSNAMHRLKDNPLEKKFHLAWKDQNEKGNTLAYLMGNGSYRAPLSDRDELVAATVVQWLGSPVGQAFLEEVLAPAYERHPQKAREPFQARVDPWLITCFGQRIARNKRERNHRFLEEALELVQSTGCTKSEAHQLVDYVWGRPAGDPPQEVGGVMVTLAALCLAQKLDMHANGETELARIWTKVEQIRQKQAAKPKHSPLPE